MTVQFTAFERVAAMPEPSLSLIASSSDNDFADLLERTGIGFIGDGFFRVIDPAALAPLTDSAVSPLDDGAVPVFVTGLGDIVYVVNGKLRIYRYRHGLRDSLLGTRPNIVVRILEDPRTRPSHAPDGGYTETVERLGRPGLDECFGYVPLIAMGGAEKPENLTKQPLVPHVEFVVSTAGIPLLKAR